MSSKFNLHVGNNVDVLKTFPDDHFDSVVTDPPYGIDFLGKDWDSHTGSIDTYRECLRVLKPGGHLLAFSAARTYHHLAMSVELAGFEIRDQIMWIYSSGFPKSQDVGRSIQRSLGVKKTKKDKGLNGFTSKNGTAFVDEWNRQDEKNEQPICTDEEAKRWEGWGTSLKPAHEPIVVARKPAKLSISKNVQVWGTGAVNIDACRVGDEVIDTSINRRAGNDYYEGEFNNKPGGELVTGRFPSNVLGELGEYQKYFYCPKVSRKERHMGYDLSIIPTDPGGILNSANGDGHYTGSKQTSPGNNHPTVKPQKLMEYLIKLVTPKGGKVLDPFNGSGSTGMAAVKLGHHYTGIDLDDKYIEISRKRITAWNTENTTYDSLFSEEE